MGAGVSAQAFLRVARLLLQRPGPAQPGLVAARVHQVLPGVGVLLLDAGSPNEGKEFLVEEHAAEVDDPAVGEHLELACRVPPDDRGVEGAGPEVVDGHQRSALHRSRSLEQAASGRHRFGQERRGRRVAGR